MILSVPVTHSDWMLHLDAPLTPETVQHMLDECKASGWTRIYWRLFDGGRVTYASKLADPVGKFDEDHYYDPKNPEDYPFAFWMKEPNGEEERQRILDIQSRMDYEGFDTLAEAVRYGHEIGLEIHAWITINEDDHGWGATSRFTRENPQSRWRRRDGSYYRSQQSFAFPEVQEYKLAIIREVLENYEIEGIFLDWMRTGDVRDDPQNDEEGVANFGYEEPLVESFKTKYGVDPHSIPNDDERWVAWRAEPQTEFMREVRGLMRTMRPTIPLAVMGQHPWGNRSGYKLDGNLRGLLLDTRNWAEEGLMDSIVATGYYRDGGNAEMAYHQLREETLGLVDTWLFGWVANTPEEFRKDVELAQRLGTSQILYWEGDYIETKENKAELQESMNQVLVASLD